MKRVTLSFLLLAAGCGGGGAAFSLTYPDNQPEQLDAVMSRVASAPSTDGAIAAGVSVSPPRLFAYDLSAQRRLWEETIEAPRTAPHLAGDLVVLHEGSRIVGRRLSDGQSTFTVSDDNLSLVGAGGEGSLAAFVISTTGGVQARSRVYVVRGGGIARRIDLDAPAGVPDVRGGLVFVPWASQNVSVLDGESGAEIARLRYQGGVVGHARATTAGVFFGQRGVGRVSRDAALSPESVGWFEPSTADLPGRPELWRSAYEPPPGADSATHNIRLAWTPAEGDGPVRPSDDTLYLTFYRLVFGLAPDLSVRWVYEHPADLVGAQAREGGVVVADAGGGVLFLGADGRERFRADMGMPATAVSLRIGGLAPSAEGAAPAPLRDQLLAAAQSRDARLVPGRAFAVRALAALGDPEVAPHILTLCDDRALPAELRRAACDALSETALGPDVVLAALERRASFLADTSAPPSAALARAAARLGERRAVPHLIAHLRHPDTPIESIPAIAAALAQLTDPSAVEALSAFLWLYRAEGEEEAMAQALAAVARALAQLGARTTIDEALAAPFTSANVRQRVGSALEELAREQASAEQPAN
jgi:hypothetical protein